MGLTSSGASSFSLSLSLGFLLIRVSRSLGIGGEVLAILLEELMLKGAFKVIVLHFVEAVHVELPDKAVHFLVPEVAGQNNFFELYNILDDEFESIG